jgi:SAM-dependent methyltransferase
MCESATWLVCYDGIVKRRAAAADRNKDPILEALREILPTSGTVLEIASGTGQHAAYFASALPALKWQPSDTDPSALASIAAHRSESGLANLEAPLSVDASSNAWPIEHAEAVVCINMIHIAPWAVCLGLIRGAARILPGRGPLVLYGPFSIDGDFTAPSNVAFDQRLRGENPEWGVRELRDVEAAAQRSGLTLERIVPRPANNHIVVFRRSGDAYQA